MALVTFSSDHFAKAERIEAAQDLYAAMSNVQLDISRGSTPSINARIQLLPGVAIALVKSSSLTAIRNSSHIADGNDDISILVNPGGVGKWASRQHTHGELVCCSDNTGCLALNEHPGSITFHGKETLFLSISFPNLLMEPLVKDIGRAAKTALVPNEAFQRLTNRALQLVQKPQIADYHDPAELGIELLDLGSLTLGATAEAKAKARGRGLRAARLRAIKADISALSLRGDITLSQIASRHSISPSYLRALFRNENTSFTDYLLEQRLHRTFKQLSHHQQTPISTIAFQAGFNNLSWFYRAFKQRYGITPGEVRDIPDLSAHVM
ncbi:AraC family transcriptional regulator [Vreelandella titanicae]|uniref:AraC family transcriptional regulator n=1 Tax=Vreelandella titanicae TaxID=664683 RepID=UPI001144C04A|nr:AraC family transcriptional regulator [Halomonas titanicae]